ncbi:DUF2744 domain-containing protein [Rhodococcus sp. CSLK01-03]|uniref:DUF2744 domain-containing protein n=1 Tax=Rhodococcus indonesiensis TaxID=3055869 RepID=A0ABT7RM36_9NOCA|nr:DUF2744 domain-containing protein [Rhodococcus indonesiensis]MDM7488703.1 DUF2744 domain-containing protein [Rhodococcus indonesiensis]
MSQDNTAPKVKAFTDSLGRIDGKTFDQWPAWEGRGLPLRGNCDPKNPRQAFLWMFTALPGVQGAPLPLPTDYWETVSWRQWQLGARPTEEPQLKYQPPMNMVADRWTAAGKWVTLDTPDPVYPTMTDIVSKLSQQDRAELKAVITEKLGFEDVPEPSAPAGHLRVDALAARLGTETADVIELLGNWGMPVGALDYVDRAVGERIAAHMGL